MKYIIKSPYIEISLITESHENTENIDGLIHKLKKVANLHALDTIKKQVTPYIESNYLIKSGKLSELSSKGYYVLSTLHFEGSTDAYLCLSCKYEPFNVKEYHIVKVEKITIEKYL